MLDKYAADPDFREILRSSGPAVIPPIARADSAPEALAHLKSKPRWSWSESLAHKVLTLSGDAISAITWFVDTSAFLKAGLPDAL